VIMWVPAGIVYTIAAAALFVAWLRHMEKRMQSMQTEHEPARSVST
jgi:hypothetical protein